jgi:hypothetical protein
MSQSLVFTGLDHQLISVPISEIESLQSDQLKRAILCMTGGGTIIVRESYDAVRQALRCVRIQ